MSASNGSATHGRGAGHGRKRAPRKPGSPPAALGAHLQRFRQCLQQVCPRRAAHEIVSCNIISVPPTKTHPRAGAKSRPYDISRGICYRTDGRRAVSVERNKFSGQRLVGLRRLFRHRARPRRFRHPQGTALLARIGSKFSIKTFKRGSDYAHRTPFASMPALPLLREETITINAYGLIPTAVP